MFHLKKRSKVQTCFAYQIPVQTKEKQKMSVK